MKNHEKVHDLQPPLYQCKECKKEFESRFDLQNHQKKHITLPLLKIYRCKHCDEKFYDLKLLINHTSEKHKNEAIVKENPIQNKVMYKCRTCGAEFKTLSFMKDHLSVHNIQTKAIFQFLKYKCIECGSEHDTIYDYFQHASTHMGIPTIVKTQDVKMYKAKPLKKLSCPDCSKQFPSQSSLQRHLGSHQNRWPRKCKFCSVTIDRRGDYLPHVNACHDDLKSYKCDLCSKKFFKETNLNSHKKIHSGERNFMCDICGFSFQAQNNLVSIFLIIEYTKVLSLDKNFCSKILKY